MKVVTRFAPSPTGYLHIGSARTALFNWLFAKHHGGTFCLRIEDTDRARSTDQAVDAILDGMSWLGLDWDGETVFQFARAGRHAEVAKKLLDEGKAYLCYCTPEELEIMKAEAKEKGLPPRYNGFWRDRDASLAPQGVAPVVRLKMPQSGETTVPDLVQGEVKVAHSQLDDMVLLRGDGTPTYMLSVVVDDHDMGITHVIRGDDHLTNTFRQVQLYKACGWDVPHFAHIPLIHGSDGAKLSKRHGALGVDAYRDMGYLPEALRNYLLRLGWSHGDEEIIPTEKAIEWFDLDTVGRSAARFDFAKLDAINSHYLRQESSEALCDLIWPRFEEWLGVTPEESAKKWLIAGMDGLKLRAKTLKELVQASIFYVKKRPLSLADDKAKSFLTAENNALLEELTVMLESLSDFSMEKVEEVVRTFVEAKGLKLGAVAQPLRVSITGSTVSPSLFEIMGILGKEESLARIKDATQGKMV